MSARDAIRARRWRGIAALGAARDVKSAGAMNVLRKHPLDPPADRPAPSVPVLAGLALWLAAAIALTAAGVLAAAPRAVGGVIFTLTLVGLVLHHRSATVRAFVASLDVRVLILFHVIRAPIGLAFLVFHGRGLLPEAFAVRGGYGDILAGVLALGAAAIAMRAPRVALAWNVLGLLDIAMVLVTAQKLLLLDRDPLMLSAAANLPLIAMLPFFVVPLVILTHLAIFQKLRAQPSNFTH